MPISRLALATAAMTRLTDTVTNATGHYGQVGQGLPGQPSPGQPVAGAGGYVRPYWVLFPSPGTPSIDEDLCDTHEDLDWLIQVTAVAGFTHDLTALVDRLHLALHGWRPVVAGIACTALKPPPGYNPGPYFTDKDTQPPRLWTPLQYRTLATT